LREEKTKEEKKRKKSVDIRRIKEEKTLREITVKIELEKIDIQERITVEALLDNEAMELVMSSEFVQRQEFKLKKIEKPIYIRNVDGTFN